MEISTTSSSFRINENSRSKPLHTNSDNNRTIAEHDNDDFLTSSSISIGERRSSNVEYDDIISDSIERINISNYEESERQEDTERKEIRPISIMLRNCFPPSQAIAEANSVIVSETTTIQREGNQNEETITNNDDYIREEHLDHMTNEIHSFNQTVLQEGQTRDEDDEDDTTLNNYQIFTKANQWRDQAKRNIFLPIEMEIVVSYSFVFQLYSYQKDEKVRTRIKDLFGLDSQSNKIFIEQFNEFNAHNFYKKKKHDDRLVVLCSKLQDTRSSHPLWEHVNEKLDDLYDLIPQGHEDLWNDLYKAMRIQFRAIVPSHTNSDFVMTESNNPILHSMSKSSNDVSCKQSKSILLASSPLHPYKLKPITPAVENSLQIESSSILLGSSTFKLSIPQSLPPNSILIHFSDGTTRVCPELYSLLLSHGVLNTNKADRVSDDFDVDKFAKRFDDNIFDVLEDQGYVKAKFKTNNNIESSGLLEFPSIHGIEKGSQPLSRSSSKGAFADAFESMANSNDIQNLAEMKKELESVDIDDSSSHHSLVYENNNENDPDFRDSIMSTSNQDYLAIDIERTKEEITVLERQIERLESKMNVEEGLLGKTLEAKALLSDNINSIEESIYHLENEVKEVEEEYWEIKHTVDFAQLLLDGKREKILREIFLIYPIQILPDSIYTIRGIHIPHDMHSLTTPISDEFISAGLGFVCHVVSLCSKYLAIPLRYRVICNSSRSAVRDDDFDDVFPLFKERVIEKAQFDRAVELLHRNIDLLLQMNGITTDMMKSRPNHILAKLHLLFKEILET